MIVVLVQDEMSHVTESVPGSRVQQAFHPVVRSLMRKYAESALELVFPVPKPQPVISTVWAAAASNAPTVLSFSPKLRVFWMPRPPLACAFAPSAAVCPDYLRRVSGMAAPMSSKAWRCWLVGSVRTGTAAGVPAKRSSLRVRVPRWASSPGKLR